MSTVESISTLRFFFFNDTATTEIYTLSLHDALPIYSGVRRPDLRRRRRLAGRNRRPRARGRERRPADQRHPARPERRSEEHTSELQSQSNLVCRLLLEKKNNNRTRCNVKKTTHLTRQ